MNQPKIVNLKQVLKDAMFDFINNYPYSVSINDLSKIDQSKIDKFIHWLIYENKRSPLIHDFIEIEHFDSLKFNEEGEVTDFTLTGVEAEYKTSLKIKASFSGEKYCSEQQEVDYIFDEGYLFRLMQKYMPRELYKASPRFKNTKPIKIQTKDLAVVRDTNPSENKFDKLYDIYGGVFIYFFNNKPEEIFKTHMVDFINDPQQLILETSDLEAGKPKALNRNPNATLFNGIRLYKLPDMDYSQEYRILEKVMAKWGDMPRIDYHGYMTSCVSFELSPDNYLELYATTSGFNLLFSSRVLSGEHDIDFILPATADNVEESFIMICKKFGSLQNKLFQESCVKCTYYGRHDNE